MRSTSIDAALREAFARELRALSPRQPQQHEIERALAGEGLPRLRRASPRRRSLNPVCVLAALCLVAALFAPNHIETRPLAQVLSKGLPEDCGERFQAFLVSAGESLRELR